MRAHILLLQQAVDGVLFLSSFLLPGHALRGVKNKLNEILWGRK
jgi:hypothetical protein